MKLREIECLQHEKRAKGHVKLATAILDLHNHFGATVADRWQFNRALHDGICLMF